MPASCLVAVELDEIHYFDRYRNELCREDVYGDAFLRWTYGTVPGRLALNAIVKRAVFSHWYGWRMDRPKTRSRIGPFIETYGLDPDEFAKRPEQFDSFNDFFSRKLKPTVRPIDARDDVAVFPADGRHLCVPDLSRSEGFFVKGESLDLPRLLDDDRLTDQFGDGALLMSRLCPVDYHRFHFPVAGVPGVTRLINGPLFSVNPIALRRNLSYLTQNKRTITEVQTESLGTVLAIEVGATCVGTIRQTFAPETSVKKGDEKGYFRFGGSCTITVFERGRITFADDLVHHSAEHRELYAKMGDVLGSCRQE